MPELDEHYHSIHGAYNEAMHVFIDAGLNEIQIEPIRILEIGFGTGLNALLTLRESLQFNQEISYTGIEKYPITLDEANLMQYTELIADNDIQPFFHNMHQCQWSRMHKITPLFSLTKLQLDFSEIDFRNTFDLIYFDAFAPSAQPNLWTEEIFNTMYSALVNRGMLVTYCAQGQVKRNMKAAGFIVERLPGPPGKREMTRAIKNTTF